MKISVIIPLFNKRDTINSTLESVLKQSYKPYEIIVVNDGSSDGSEKIVIDFKGFPIKLFHQDNFGVSSARNRGINEARGEWIAFLDADDIWNPSYLETISFLAKTYPECAVLATAYEFENYLGIRKPITIRKLKFRSESGILNNYFEVASCSNPPLWTSAVVVKKEAIVNIGGFPEGVKVGEDLLTWAKLAVSYKIAYSKRVLSVFVLDPSHSVSESPTRLPDENDYVGTELKKIYYGSNGKLHIDLKNYLSLWYKMRASAYLRNSERYKVWVNSLKSLKYDAFNYKNYFFLILSCLPAFIQRFAAKLYSL